MKHPTPRQQQFRVCAVEDCARETKGGGYGWCSKHYQRWKNHGDPLWERPAILCAVADCQERAYGRGWCSLHYGRWKNHGDPEFLPEQNYRPGARPKPLCSVVDCEKPSKARGWCATHYQRWMRGAVLDAPVRGTSRYRRKVGVCSIDDCAQPLLARGWCAKHYKRWRDHGDPNFVARPYRAPVRPVCTVDGCEQQSRGRGWCGKHYQRNLRHGSPTYGDDDARRSPALRRLLRRYNLTSEQYDALVVWQGGRCAMCDLATPELHVDHDHDCCRRGSCGECVRGLLCRRCNQGTRSDDVAHLRARLDYLSDWPSRRAGIVKPARENVA